MVMGQKYPADIAKGYFQLQKPLQRTTPSIEHALLAPHLDKRAWPEGVQNGRRRPVPQRVTRKISFAASGVIRVLSQFILYSCYYGLSPSNTIRPRPRQLPPFRHPG